MPLFNDTNNDNYASMPMYACYLEKEEEKKQKIQKYKNLGDTFENFNKKQTEKITDFQSKLIMVKPPSPDETDKTIYERISVFREVTSIIEVIQAEIASMKNIIVNHFNCYDRKKPDSLYSKHLQDIEDRSLTLKLISDQINNKITELASKMTVMPTTF